MTKSIHNIDKTNFIVDISSDKVITKGIGAGGSRTNENGLSFESQTNITKYFTSFEIHKLNKKYI